MKATIGSIYIILFLILADTTPAVEPVVSNVQMEQRIDSSGIVDIRYDLTDSDSPAIYVSLQFSIDGGETWDFPVVGDFTGDINANITPGAGKHISWSPGSLKQTLSLTDIRAKVIASDVGVRHMSHSPGNVAITDFSAIDWADPANVEKFAQADLLLLMGHNLWLGGGYADVPILQQLRTRNPEIVILAYVSVKSAQLNGSSQPPESYWYKWLERTSPYEVFTTEGTPAMDWPDTRLINILEPDCRKVMIETIMEMQSNSLNIFDGLYWDYFSNSLWAPVEVENQGDPDMDGNGIGHWDDPGERIAFRQAQVDIVTATRDSLGENFIQFFNGTRAYLDPQFAALADGAYYEMFPTIFFPDPDMGHALDPSYEHSLFNQRPRFRTSNGGPYMVLGSIWYNGFLDTNGEIQQIKTGNPFRAISLVADTYATWNSGDGQMGDLVYGWPSQDISLGAPLGPATFEGKFIRRSFTYGQIEIEITSGAYPDPFDYRIWVLGTLIEELAIPRHTP